VGLYGTVQFNLGDSESNEGKLSRVDHDRNHIGVSAWMICKCALKLSMRQT
jgi:hypothetical protein